MFLLTSVIRNNYTKYINTDDIHSQAELYILNYSETDDLRVKVIPMGVIFRGDLTYRLDCFHPLNYQYIYGGSKDLPHKQNGTISSFE